MERLLFTAEAPFEAARSLDGAAPGHRARRLHGHGFVASVHAALGPQWAGFAGGEARRLQQRLQRCVEPLDYRLLNEELEEPSDESLARWLKARLDVPGIERVAVRSTAGQGVELDRAGRAQAWRRYRFEAAHRLPNVPAGHKCGRMHGHGFEVVLHARAGREGAIDYERLDRHWAPLQAQFHLACLNEIEGLENPTSEMLAGAIWRRLKPEAPELVRVTVYETAACGAHFDGCRYRIWTETTLDSALRLKRAPDGDPRRRVHGHTYTLRLHLTAALHDVLGWTIDFGDVKEIFRPVFLKLDHQPLHELAGLEDNDVATLARWIRAQIASELPQLERIDVFDAGCCGALLAWGTDEAGQAL
jgi:6-pyruvoyltetrahydropterin/6-carboxytetrahydropterin synthase